jgi:hypothetical protein
MPGCQNNKNSNTLWPDSWKPEWLDVTIARQWHSNHVCTAMNQDTTQELLAAVSLCGPCQGYIASTSSSSQELELHNAHSCETAKYDHESQGTWNQEWLCWQVPAATQWTNWLMVQSVSSCNLGSHYLAMNGKQTGLYACCSCSDLQNVYISKTVIVICSYEFNKCNCQTKHHVSSLTCDTIHPS